MEQPLTNNKPKSIFTDVVHLAGLTDGSKAPERNSVLDLRTKAAHQSQAQLGQPLDPDLHHKPSSSISTLFDRNPFAPASFLSTEPFSPLLAAHSLHDFLPGNMTVLGGQSGPSGPGLPLCWPASYAHTAASFLSPFQFRSQFSHLAYTAPNSTDLTGVRETNVDSNGVGPSRSLPPSAAAAAVRAKQAPRFQCPDCNRVYSTFSGLSKHRQFHCAAQMKKQFGCKFCQKHYTSLGALKMHIRTHTLPCKCELCGKAFSRPWLLQGHVRTHTGEKPFRCLHCGRAFADRSNLRAHLQTHSDVKKYRCPCCQKTFSRMSLLTKHENNGCPGVGHS